MFDLFKVVKLNFHGVSSATFGQPVAKYSKIDR